MKAELLREINGRFLLNELGDPPFFFILHLISKLEFFYYSIFRKIRIDSLLQSDFRHFTESEQTLDLPII